VGKIVIDPITRIEGHLRIEAVVQNGEVKDCKSSGTLFRGLELILKGRDPRDAQRITQRICGVCPTSHSTAATLNLDSAFGLADKIPDNGRIMRNLILGAAHIADHILHFYHLAALDYVDVASVANYDGNDPALNSVKAFIQRGELGPFLPRYEGDYRLPEAVNIECVAHYVKALEMRRKGQEMVALLAGKLPHNMGIVPGGVTEVPTVDKMTSSTLSTSRMFSQWQVFTATTSRLARGAGISSPTGATNSMARIPISPSGSGCSSRGRSPLIFS
jgi:hydrogenase large subunit